MEENFVFKDVYEKLFEVKVEVWGIIGFLILLYIGYIIINKAKNQDLRFKEGYTKKIVYGGVSIALAFVLSYIRIYRMPQGGSITVASMLPMFVYSFIFGPIAGIIAGIAYGFLQLIQDLYVVHWMQLFLDYPLAFGLMGLAGTYGKHLSIACFIGGLGRYFMHFLSGAIFFGEYAPEGMNVYLYSLMYNGSLMVVEVGVCILVSFLLYKTPVMKEIKRIV